MASIKVRFVNKENPEFPLDFVYNGKKYHFNDEATYKLPQYIVDHINGLAVPIQKFDSKLKKLVTISRRTRFMMIPE